MRTEFVSSELGHWSVVTKCWTSVSCPVYYMTCCCCCCIVVVWLCHTAYWSLVPQTGMEHMPLHWKCRVLATGLPGKSLPYDFQITDKRRIREGKKELFLITMDHKWLTSLMLRIPYQEVDGPAFMQASSRKYSFWLKSCFSKINK